MNFLDVGISKEQVFLVFIQTSARIPESSLFETVLTFKIGHFANFKYFLQRYHRMSYIKIVKGEVHGSAHVPESKYFFAFACHDLRLFNCIRCL